MESDLLYNFPHLDIAHETRSIIIPTGGAKFQPLHNLTARFMQPAFLSYARPTAYLPIGMDLSIAAHTHKAHRLTMARSAAAAAATAVPRALCACYEN